MRVVATAPGYFGALRVEGDEFEVPDGTKGSWFKPVAADVAKPSKGSGKGQAPKPGPEDDEAANAI